MEYVMVPVPEELVADVEQLIRQSSAKAQASFLDEATAARLLSEFDPRARDILLAVADAGAAGKAFTVADAADAAGCSQPEVLGLLVVVNNMVVAAGGPLAIVPMIKGSSLSGLLVIVRDVAHTFLAAAHEVTDAHE